VAVRRVVPLILGWVEVPHAMSVEGGEEGRRLVEPVPALALDTADGWVLVDTGLNPAALRDAALYQRVHLATGVRAWPAALEGTEAGGVPDQPSTGTLGPDGPGAAGPADPLAAALEAAGLAASDIGAVVLTHLHNDHAGGLFHFAGRDVEVFVQRAELDFGLRTPAAALEAEGIVRLDYDRPGLRWHPLDGPGEVAPGVAVVPSAGHTPGHQSVAVTMAGAAAGEATAGHGDGGGPPGYVFAADAADLTENIDDERAIGGRIGASPAESVAVIRALKAQARALGFPLVPGHDTAVWLGLVAGAGAAGAGGR
jgi:glyoxylase-like metal-dependent hydrolase (beta-lactamase superfamily II)